MILSCRKRDLRRKEAERKKNEFLKELPPGMEEKNLLSGDIGSALTKTKDSATSKPGGKKKIYSVNGNVRTDQDSVAPVRQEEEPEVREYYKFCSYL